MSEERFDLVFRGQLAKSVELSTAIRNLAQLFKIDPAKAKALFSGKRAVLKRNLDFQTGNKYRVAIKKAGAIAELEAIEAVQVDVKADPASSAAPKSSAKASFAARDSVSPVANTRQQQQTPQSGQQKPKPEKQEQPPLPIVEETGEQEFTTSAGVFVTNRPEPVNIPVPNFDVAPAGEDLLKQGERVEVIESQIDVSAYSVKEGEGTLLNEDEYQEFVPLPVDENIFDVAPPGADVLKPEERKKEVDAHVDISGLSLDESGTNLAPPKPAEPPPPDTSKISLVD